MKFFIYISIILLGVILKSIFSLHIREDDLIVRFSREDDYLRDKKESLKLKVRKRMNLLKKITNGKLPNLFIKRYPRR